MVSKLRKLIRCAALHITSAIVVCVCVFLCGSPSWGLVRPPKLKQSSVGSPHFEAKVWMFPLCALWLNGMVAERSRFTIS